MANFGEKRYPNLARYLEIVTKPAAADGRRVLLTLMGVFGSVAMLMGLVSLVAALSSHNKGELDSALICIATAFGFAASAVLVHRLLPEPPERSALEEESKAASQLLQKHMHERRIHKAAPTPVLTLLEEASRQYLRIKSSLSSTTWRTPNLPENYFALRQRADLAADRTMQEIIVVLRPRFVENTAPRNWKDVVEDVAEQIGFRTQSGETVFPSELQPVLMLADGLRNLANEVEQASLRAMTDVPNSVSADAALRSCLSDLRALNEAEQELDSSLRQKI